MLIFVQLSDVMPAISELSRWDATMLKPQINMDIIEKLSTAKLNITGFGRYVKTNEFMCMRVNVWFTL